jgi:site-specific DNA-adenine methylase
VEQVLFLTFKPANAFISDANKDIIGTYTAIKENQIKSLNILKLQWDKRYYLIRSLSFADDFQKLHNLFT